MLSPATVRAVRARVGIVFADPDDQIVGLTVEEDVAFGPRARRWAEAEVRAAVGEALAAVGLVGREARFPTTSAPARSAGSALRAPSPVGRGSCSWTQPSSGLDPRGCRELAELLSGLGATLVVASHDLVLVERLCARAIVLDDGRCVADAPIGEVLEDRALPHATASSRRGPRPARLDPAGARLLFGR